MDRGVALQRLVHQAQLNGFDFRLWFQTHVRATWPGAEAALTLLAAEGRHYTLLFSHDFARSFWRSGAPMTLAVPSVTYTRVNTRGDAIQVTRKPFTRRMIKRDVWKYHLRQMAAAEDPIAYLVRFLPVNIPDRQSDSGRETIPARV